jgi:hypothetical protein
MNEEIIARKPCRECQSDELHLAYSAGRFQVQCLNCGFFAPSQLSEKSAWAAWNRGEIGPLEYKREIEQKEIAAVAALRGLCREVTVSGNHKSRTVLTYIDDIMDKEFDRLRRGIVEKVEKYFQRLQEFNEECLEPSSERDGGDD